jgi:hypothetical protein
MHKFTIYQGMLYLKYAHKVLKLIACRIGKFHKILDIWLFSEQKKIIIGSIAFFFIIN